MRRPNLTRAGSDADELHERADARGPEKHQRGEFREEAETDCYAEGDRQAPPRAAVRSEKFYLEKDPHQREEAREGLGVDHGVRVKGGGHHGGQGEGDEPRQAVSRKVPFESEPQEEEAQKPRADGDGLDGAPAAAHPEQEPAGAATRPTFAPPCS